jgi:hypothetical protein
MIKTRRGRLITLLSGAFVAAAVAVPAAAATPDTRTARPQAYHTALPAQSPTAAVQAMLDNLVRERRPRRR